MTMTAPGWTEPAVRQPATGLTEAEAAARLARGEGNAIEDTTGRTYRRILLQNAFTPINVVLYAIVVLLLLLGVIGDALMTASLVLANVVVGVVQEARAKRQLDRISLLARPTATVVRDGQERTVPPEAIVPGDLLVARAGDQLLADGVVVTARDAAVDESLLTGESDPVPKGPGDAVSAGCFCMAGSMSYEARRVGASSTAGRLTSGARAFRQVATPLQREISLVIRVTAVAMVALGVEVAATSHELYAGRPLVESVRAAAVIVALVPQGLAFMVTVTYALAAVRLAGKGALIQRMNAVESSSHVDVLCLDKTGTLTTNRLNLHAIAPLTLDEPALRHLLGVFAASTTSTNRTTATIAAALPETPRRPVDEAPFSSDRKWSALAIDDRDERAIYVLGATEVLRHALQHGADSLKQEEEWTASGLRVLMFARAAEPTALHDGAGAPRLPSSLTPLGLVCLSDELRPEARETINGFASAGIALKVISGDHPETVAALARQAGMAVDAPPVSGLDLDARSDAELDELADRTAVFGRVTPAQKARLVGALRRRRHYVAMIGDGVNDVLALKQAQLAIAMRSGSAATRSAADIVLLDDSFAVLPHAFREGQRILRGMQDIIRLFLVRTLSVTLIIALAASLDAPFPTTPRQNAVLALLTVGIPALALAAWARPGATPRNLVLAAARFVLPAAVSVAVAALTVFLFVHATSQDVAMARTALTITTVLCGLALILFAQPPNEAWTGGSPLNGDRRPAFLVVALLALFCFILFYRPLRTFYELVMLPASGYVMIVLVTIGWASALRFAWRERLAQRLRGLRREPRALR